jgi:hypothetical protein
MTIMKYDNMPSSHVRLVEYHYGNPPSSHVRLIEYHDTFRGFSYSLAICKNTT